MKQVIESLCETDFSFSGSNIRQYLRLMSSSPVRLDMKTISLCQILIEKF